MSRTQLGNHGSALSAFIASVTFTKLSFVDT